VQEELPRSLASRYRFERELGRGGFGRVVLGHDRELDRLVAVKLLTLDVADPEVRARFEREARVTAALSHPGVVEVYDTGVCEEGTPFIVYAYLEGAGLPEQEADPARLRTWAVALAEALQAVHDAGLVHRDVKPENVLLGEGDRPVLCDLGIVRALSPRPETLHTEEGLILGTPAYMAPELWRGYPATPASDQFAWAATLVRVATGRGVYPSPEPGDILAGLEGWRPDLTGISPELTHALRRALDPDPDRRFPDLVAAVAALGVGEDQAAPTLHLGRAPAGPSDAAPTAVQARSPRRGAPSPPVSTLAIVLAVGLLAWSRSGPPTPPPVPLEASPSPAPAERYRATVADLRSRLGALRELVGASEVLPEEFSLFRSHGPLRVAWETLLLNPLMGRIREVLEAVDAWLDAGRDVSPEERTEHLAWLQGFHQFLEELDRAAGWERSSLGRVEDLVGRVGKRLEAEDRWKHIRARIDAHLDRQVEEYDAHPDPFRLAAGFRLAFAAHGMSTKAWVSRMIENGRAGGPSIAQTGADFGRLADTMRAEAFLDRVDCETRVTLLPGLHDWVERQLRAVARRARADLWKSVLRVEVDLPHQCGADAGAAGRWDRLVRLSEALGPLLHPGVVPVNEALAEKVHALGEELNRLDPSEDPRGPEVLARIREELRELEQALRP
jgi:hypothetical protein